MVKVVKVVKVVTDWSKVVIEWSKVVRVIKSGQSGQSCHRLVKSGHRMVQSGQSGQSVQGG